MGIVCRAFMETNVQADAAGAISGVAWKFATPDRIGDMIEKGAFSGAVLPIPMLFGHDMNDPIGVWEAAVEKADGLHLSGKLLVDDVPRAREVRALVQAGAVRGISIGFVARKAVARPGGGRTIKALELVEASLVVVPMHPGARVTSAKDAVSALRLADALQRATAQLAARK
uniref:Phage prohead protease, HK97 family n=1 Tax=Cereibacter sphaeroides (strain ATCC 17025 / ATH 2.4.3) TaxID=349102 RepID=A4WS91_CERS5